MAKNGGTVLGAFDRQTDHMVGFLIGFLGRSARGPLKLCSQIMGVHRSWRSTGVGEALKRAQRDRAVAQDLPLITWTYDPLEGPNAALNLHKLRGVSRIYQRDIYGDHLGSLNAGLPTDRLLVEWWVQGDRVAKAANTAHLYASAQAIFEIAGTGAGRTITQTRLDLTAPILLLETVADLQTAKVETPALALDWRLKVREAFESYFAQGYIATDFHSHLEPEQEGVQRRNAYILQRLTPQLRAEIGLEPEA
jgi:predicted GNAT superfamily acetyltransferase